MLKSDVFASLGGSSYGVGIASSRTVSLLGVIFEHLAGVYWASVESTVVSAGENDV
jgi:hypothetical protein